jgi:hypothetical protein
VGGVLAEQQVKRICDAFVKEGQPEIVWNDNLAYRLPEPGRGCLSIRGYGNSPLAMTVLGSILSWESSNV